jgi:acetyl esterase/lipase
MAAALALAAEATAQPRPPGPPQQPQQAPAQTPGGGQGQQPQGTGGSGEVRRVRWSQQVRLPSDITVARNLEFARAGETPLLLDLYIPENAPKPRPLVVWIHGGGWQSGSKDQCRATPMVHHGYVVASISYRLTHQGSWPAQIQDCKAAIRWLRANADAYGIDPQRIGVWGSSAGGHLAALLGTTADVKELDGDLGHPDQSSRVQAVCAWAAPTDLVAMARQAHRQSQVDHAGPDAPEALLLGGPIAELLDKARAASPLTYVNAKAPPFLLMHGDNDRVVPHQQSVAFDEALRKAGVESRLHTVAGSGHAFGGQALHEQVLEFFGRHLKPATADHAPPPPPPNDTPPPPGGHKPPPPPGAEAGQRPPAPAPAAPRPARPQGD